MGPWLVIAEDGLASLSGSRARARGCDASLPRRSVFGFALSHMGRVARLAAVMGARATWSAPFGGEAVSAMRVYDEVLVPRVFEPWARLLIDLRSLAVKVCATSPAGRDLSPGSLPSGSEPAGG